MKLVLCVVEVEGIVLSVPGVVLGEVGHVPQLTMVVLVKFGLALVGGRCLRGRSHIGSVGRAFFCLVMRVQLC